MEDFEKEEMEKKDRQLDHLINLVENYTRSKRHLEQYSEIGDPKNKQNAREKQQVREEQIGELKGQIIGKCEETTKIEQLENLKQNYEISKEYIENNLDNMDQEMYDNLEKKQKNRRNQIQQLEDNINE